jgi:hypothetical protein
MGQKSFFQIGASVLVVLALMSSGTSTWAQNSNGTFLPTIPKTWDDVAIASLEVPLPVARLCMCLPTTATAFPVRAIYRTYPRYRPGKEPPGYMAMQWRARGSV